jgi:HAD superfamily hydrolase (TIGR01509 family)
LARGVSVAARRGELARLGPAGAALVFVDDVEANVEAAGALGWRGVWFR